MANFTTLYSGSSGNCAVIEENGRFLLVDMGASCKATLGGMVAAGLVPHNLLGILITHEHSDHIKGLKVFLKRIPVPVVGTAATLQILTDMDALPPNTSLVEIESGSQALNLDGFRVRHFSTSHDAADSGGWVVQTPLGATMALATDLGHMTPEIYTHLSRAQLVALEANYDPMMLQTGPYPSYLKRRIASSSGHLSNPEAAGIVAELIRNGCRRVMLCHLSAENNRPSLVQQAIADALLQHGLRLPEECKVQIAKRHEASIWMDF